MKIIGVMNLMDMDKFAGYAVGSMINHVDQLYVGLGPSQDGVSELLEAIRLMVGDKLVVFPEVAKEYSPGGSSGLKNKIFDIALRDNPSWIFHLDGDHIFYPLVDLGNTLDRVKYDAGIIRTHQVYLYSKDRPNGLAQESRESLMTIVNPKKIPVDSSSFITFINPRFYDGWSGPAHEVLHRSGGDDIAMRQFSFVHVGPLDTEDHWIKNRIHYYKIEHPEFKSDEECRNELIQLGEIYPEGNSALRHRMRTEKVTPFTDPLPPILKNYRTGSSEEDLRNIENYIRKGLI